MKHFYSRIYRFVMPALFMFAVPNVYAQCPEGQPAGQTAFDTTVTIPSGLYNTTVKFPKFDPTTGMLTCVKLCITITGVIDSVAIENGAASGQTLNIRYRREDQITGPGFDSPPFSNSINYLQPVNLAATDGVPNSGPDYYTAVDDTVLNSKTCRTITDMGIIQNFYGPAGDSVGYDYAIDVEGYVGGTGNFSSYMATSAQARFNFEYCTCPGSYLPISLESFTVKKIAADKAELKWNGYDDPEANYYYEAEVSRNAYDYTSIGILPKNMINAGEYKMNFAALKGESGAYYFRIKQIYPNGNVKYSITRQLILESSGEIKFSVFPNPSNGIVGIKFDNISEEQFALQIYNTQGQIIVSKDLVVSGSSYVQVATLRSGVYWMRLTSKKTQVSSVNQLLIK